jgi:hypothetical protein
VAVAGHTLIGVEIWNAMRALDYLETERRWTNIVLE